MVAKHLTASEAAALLFLRIMGERSIFLISTFGLSMLAPYCR
jgi:hypothetical protein